MAECRSPGGVEDIAISYRPFICRLRLLAALAWRSQAGAAVAVACAFVVGLIGGATNTEFAYGAVLIGFLAGLAMRKIRADAQTAIAGAVVALIGSALSSVIALTLHLVKAGQIPLSFGPRQ